MSLLERVRTKEDPEPQPRAPHERADATAGSPPAARPTDAAQPNPQHRASRLVAATSAGEPATSQGPGWRERTSARLSGGADGRPPHHPQYLAIKSRVTQALLEEYSDVAQAPRERLVQKLGELTSSVLEELGVTVTRNDRQRLIEQLVNDVLGLGPLETILKDPDISEIMVNSPSEIYVERRGRIERYPASFDSGEHLMQIIDRIVSTIGRRVDESSPMVDARLRDGSRVNVVIPPIALKGPSMTIRRFSRDPYTADDLVQFGTLTQDMATFLRACVRARLNVLISGGTGSGKTTTLNVLSGWIPEDERIVTIEDAAELQLHQDHVVTLEARPANIEGRGRITIRDLVVNSLRMRPDRIVVGEVRGGEALDMLQAMNTGHDGSLTTAHANSPADALSRLETMVLMAGTDLPSRAIREQIASAIDIIVHQSRLRDGTRRIVAVSEVPGFDGERVVLSDVFNYRQHGVDEQGNVEGEFVAVHVPKCLDELAVAGEAVEASLFDGAVAGDDAA